ncbi:glycosyltransferase family 2 protein [Mesoflavibacter sp. CH_XMU1422-2]|uniref:glycosyltransferase family 2 protein n=1 Tax=Mesoflavibacter sp. CH_XMU1422-2 TaxID=3107770 RepID=UPI00300BAB2C
MNKNIKITFIVPCYNQAHFLSTSLETVLNQTYDNWECIIVNDGSTDNTENIALQWVDKDSRFKYLKKENGGLSSARNFGIKHVTSQYVFPLDADDKIDIAYLEKAVKVLSKDPEIEVLTSQVKLFGTKNEVFNLPQYNFKTLLLQNCLIACSIFKKETFERVGGYDENLSSFEDWDFWISALKDGGKFYKLEEVLYYYRKQEKDTLTSRFYNEKGYYDSLHDYIYQKHLNLYLEYFPNFIHVYNDYLLQKKFIKKIKSLLVFKVYEFIKQKIRV